MVFAVAMISPTIGSKVVSMGVETGLMGAATSGLSGCSAKTEGTASGAGAGAGATGKLSRNCKAKRKRPQQALQVGVTVVT